MDHLTESYKIYLRIASLEMEKAHRGVEHRHVSSREALLDRRFREIDDEKRRLFEAMSMRDTTLKELRPAHEERVQKIARQTAAKKAERKAAEGPQPRQIAKAEEQRRRETQAARKRGPRQPRQGFKLRY